MLATHDTTALDAAIDTEIRAALASLRTELELKLESSTAMAQPQSHPLGSHVHALAIGMVEDLTGFFVAADTLENAAAVTGDDLEDKAQYWWSPSEWGWQYTGGTAPGIVTTEIWALAKGLPEERMTRTRMASTPRSPGCTRNASYSASSAYVARVSCGTYREKSCGSGSTMRTRRTRISTTRALHD